MNLTRAFVVLFMLLPRLASADITTGLVGRWALDATSGTTAIDSSGFNNNGTLVNGPAWNSGGKLGGALSFDGVNDYVTLGNPTSLIPGSTITLAGWMRCCATTRSRRSTRRPPGPRSTPARTASAWTPTAITAPRSTADTSISPQDTRIFRLPPATGGARRPFSSTRLIGKSQEASWCPTTESPTAFPPAAPGGCRPRSRVCSSAATP